MIRMEQVKLIVLDFDGVLTDNRVWISESGEESVACDRSDGMGISIVRKKGVHVCVLSSETNKVVMERCRKLQVLCYHGVKNKLTRLRQIAGWYSVNFNQIAYIGNDINDIECMQAVGYGVAVADAHPKVLEIADIVLEKYGGRGAVREFCDKVIYGYLYYC